MAWVGGAVVVGIALAPWCKGGAVGWAVAAVAAATVVAAWPRPSTAVVARVGVLVAGICLGVARVRGIPPGPRWVGPVATQGWVATAAAGREVDLQTPDGPVRARFPDRAPPPGTRVVVRGEAQAGPGPVLPGAPDPVRSAARAGVSTWLQVASWAAAGQRAAPPAPVDDPTGLLRALARGDLSGVSEGDLEVFRRTGTLHLLSVSGFHVGVLAAAAAAVLGRVWRVGAVLRPSGTSEAPVWLAAAGIGASFAWVVGLPVPAQRAALALVLAAVGRSLAASLDPLTAVSLAAALTAAWDPGAIGTASWQLSFGGMVGLIRLSPWVTRWLPPDVPRWVSAGASAAGATVGATLGTLPAAAWWFQQLAPGALPANVVAMPLGAALVPIAGCACFGPAALAAPAAVVGTWSARLLLAVLSPLAWTPWHPATGPFGALVLALTLVAGPARPGPWIAATLLAFGLVERARCPTLTALDVGQGDAVVLEDGRGGVTLVDGGPPGEAVVRWLRRTGRRRLAVVASHGHLDHTGGLVPVVAELEVTVVWATDHAGLGPLRAVAAARGIPWAWPPAAAYGAPTSDAPNDRSLIWRDGPFLLPGDLEATGEPGVADGPPAAAPVLKVAHHGSAGATTEAWLDAVRPRIAVVSAGRGNGYGHPHDALLERLRARGVRLWRTDVHGTVSIAAAPGGLRVQSWRPGAGWTPPVTVGEMP